MSMSPSIRKLALTAHVTTSVGWLGAVAGFFVLSIAGLTSTDAETVRGAYVAMNLIGQYAIVPLSFAALLTGIIQSLGTPWGLFRYYWVVIKLALTIGATLLLVLHQFTAVAGAAQHVAASAPGTLPETGRWGTQLVGDAGAAILVLLGITILAIFKPWGVTAYGRRKQRLEKPESDASEALNDGGEAANVPIPIGLKIFLAVGAVLVTAFVVLHLTGHGMQHGH